MARILIIGGGFGGLVTAERLSAMVGSSHEITLVSPNQMFTFYPALVHLAFGECTVEDIQSDMKSRLREYGVHFIEGEFTNFIPDRKAVEISGKDLRGELSYDYIVFALGRRLATEKVAGFFKYSHHMMTVNAAREFGEAVHGFKSGNIVVGACPGARLPVPVCETAFQLAKLFREQMDAGDIRIKVVFPESLDEAFGGARIHEKFEAAFSKHGISVLYDVPITKVTEDAVYSSEGHKIGHDLLMLIPPFKGHSSLSSFPFTDKDDFIMVDGAMRILNLKHAYAIGDDVSFSGPKFAHMAVQQAQVAAANICSEIKGEEPAEMYYHEIATIVNAGGSDSIYLHYGIWDQELFRLKKGRFWGIAKDTHDSLWQAQHG